MVDPSILHAQDFLGLRYVVLPIVAVPIAVLFMVCVSLIIYVLIRVILACVRCLLRRRGDGLDELISATLALLILYALFAIGINYNIYLVHQAKYQYHKTDCILRNVTAIEQSGLSRYTATVIIALIVVSNIPGDI